MKKVLKSKKENHSNNNSISPVMLNCIDVIESRGMEVEGIFRISGSANKLKELKKAYSKGKTPSLDNVEIHTVAGLLKHYLGDLEEPVLTYNLYLQFIDVVNIEKEMRVEYIKKLVESLPPLNQKLLHWLIVFLNKVSKYSDQNKMDLTNLGTVFGPSLLRPKDETPDQMLNNMQGVQVVIMTMLLSYPSIFEDWPDDMIDRPIKNVDEGNNNSSNDEPKKKKSLLKYKSNSDQKKKISEGIGSNNNRPPITRRKSSIFTKKDKKLKEAQYSRSDQGDSSTSPRDESSPRIQSPGESLSASDALSPRLLTHSPRFYAPRDLAKYEAVIAPVLERKIQFKNSDCIVKYVKENEEVEENDEEGGNGEVRKRKKKRSLLVESAPVIFHRSSPTEPFEVKLPDDHEDHSNKPQEKNGDNNNDNNDNGSDNDNEESVEKKDEEINKKEEENDEESDDEFDESEDSEQESFQDYNFNLD